MFKKALPCAQIIYICLVSLLLWLLIDMLNMKMHGYWGSRTVAILLWIAQYLTFLYILKDRFKNKSVLKAWYFRIFISFLILIGFTILLIPILFSFHIWMGEPL